MTEYSSIFDKMTMLAIENGVYDTDKINLVLLEYDQETLGSTTYKSKE